MGSVRVANQAGAAGLALPGCSVADDFSHELGDAAEGRIAAALAFRASNNQSCPTPSGFSEPRVAKASLDLEGRGLAVSRPFVTSNRILRASPP